MATISSLGIGSGLDVESLVSKLMSIEQQPINNIKQASAKLQTKISAYGQLQSAVSSMQTAAQKLSDASLWNASTVSVSDTSVATVSASSAGSQNHLLKVSQLASAQSVASRIFTNGSQTLGDGTLTIALGRWAGDPPVFTPGSGTPAAITVSATDTLTSIRDKINAANVGVNASLVNDAAGTRLVIRSLSTGENQAFQITTPDAALADLAYDGSGTGLSQTQAASNASFNWDGLDLTSESNTLSGLSDGMTVNLLKTTANTVNIGTSNDTTSIKKAITDFVDSYNKLFNLMRDQTKYDAGTKTAGVLQGDSKAVSVQQMLRGITGGTTTLAGAFGRLSDIGLEPGQNGTLTVNSTKLDKALTNLTDLKKLFSAPDTNNKQNQGFALRWNSFATQILGTDGAITSGQSALQKRIANNDDQIDRMQDSLTLTEKRLRAQYSALDTKMSSLSALSAYVSKQFGSSSSS
ncbi:flagellar hook-associated protein 2 [Pelomonas saccharophila]|uniref:Flagellar hook-associated protein 2 n=1 Tax=Roseateles saccharophilus TaxID=304 RepID=A0ABU1YIZ0_ROSSA|nr:flagellar filament capping protein FliD [Roseateles saccharophilus]MDR7268822.1 flagellar hook-associated protein 2 [Roseateles saccharophilus]